MAANFEPGSSFENNPLAQAILREGLLIQDRFSAEPIYAKTGKGYLKSVGVRELQELKKQQKGDSDRRTGFSIDDC